MLTVEPKRCRPLAEVTLRTEDGGEVRVYDGEGRLYRTMGGPEAVFRASGSLGTHVATLHDESGAETERATFRVDCRTEIDDEGGRFRRLLYMLKHTIFSFFRGANMVVGDGERVHLLHSITSRDTIHALKGGVYFRRGLKDVIDLHAAHQREDGMVWDFSMPVDPDLPYHFDWRWGDEWSKRINRDQVIFARQPVMNDLEHMYIGGIHLIWRATGDDEWMAGKLDSALAAMRFSRTSPYFWSEKFQLLKRPYCIDLWDYQSQYDAARVDGDIMDAEPGVTVYGVFHGDNTGMADSSRKLAEMLQHVGRDAEAREAREFSEHLLERLEEVSWNGEFYTHHVSEDPSFERDFGVDESQQVSLSNAYAVARGLDHDKVVAIIGTYRRIREEMPQSSPAEWFGIYPPFKRGWHLPEWVYTNGAVTIMTGGELAHGAFEHGFEEYGADILRRSLDLFWPHGDTFVPGLRGAMPEPPERTFQALDLREVANADLVCSEGQDHPGWAGEPGNDCRALPTGRQVFEDVPFEIIEPAGNERRACLRLAREREGFAESASIPVGECVESLYLLHAAGGRSEVVGELKLVYEDGSAHEQYIRKGRHVDAFWNPKAPDQSRRECRDTVVAWTGTSEEFWRIGLIAHGMENPHPEKSVDRVELRASRDGAVWLVVALTTSDAPPFFMPPPVDGGVPPAWGAGALTYALVEGLAGVHDEGRNMSPLRLTPRWEAAGVGAVTACVKYEEGEGYVRYRYQRDGDVIRIGLAASAEQRALEVLMPEGRQPAAVTVDGEPVEFGAREIEGSVYACFEAHGPAAREIVVELE
ncbi:MAG: hypothetical protein R6X33_03790 [Candidatus Brocadiia bacterium]